ARLRRPDRGAEWYEKAFDERVRVVAALHELGQRLFVTAVAGTREAVRALPARLVFDHAPRRSIEANDFAEQAEERRPHEVAPLREERVEVRSPELEARRRVGDAEAHLRRLGGDAELAQQRGEPRIVALVVDDEPRVDGVGPPVELDV